MPWQPDDLVRQGKHPKLVVTFWGVGSLDQSFYSMYKHLDRAQNKGYERSQKAVFGVLRV